MHDFRKSSNPPHWPPASLACSKEETANWQHLATLLKDTSVACVATPPGAAAIDASIYRGALILARLDRAIFSAPDGQQTGPVFAAITALVVSRESGTLARATLAGPWGEARLIPAESFARALDMQGAVATQNPLFEATIPSVDQAGSGGISAISAGQRT